MKLFNNIVQFDAAVLQGGGGSGLGLWSKYMLCCCWYIVLSADLT
jgi:hypothetical protein